ncbi:protein kinase domain-containing protein [Streptomyces sp. NBC_00239]|uniref:protein kinase domain-containing protein n=1 Tax=Streptomyces sp. NBC_00239 TaxID=2903640 RepID=UPI002E2D9499|nr:ABC transporter substrate-binding protein [Streptomyces sp. NBC_00239]
MRPLTSADPSSIGGHRLLGRLGTGGMGTVYLGRSPTGNLVALKVIRAEYAADPGFRARFRREAAIAARVRSPWVVEVTGADPDAREPWLATPFVPAPSLAEAVALHGPLPVPTVRVLGARLAEALTAVHAAGLIHRDVKPGNILLALDGPRLIDFGIARLAGATALTATDAVVGTPGYLAPEQARAADPGPGPAADVFALGCVLCFAATGSGPFGTGHPAAVVFRTVHEEPDLDAVPAPLAALVTACLTKDPGLRPTAEQVRHTLAPPAAAEPGPSRRAARAEVPAPAPGPDPDPDPAPAPDPSLAPGADPGAGRSAHPGSPPVADPAEVRAADPGSGPAEVPAADPGSEWLPPALPRLIAERSARALDLPAPGTTRVDTGAGGRRGPLGRRGLLAAGALVAVGAPALWFATRPASSKDPAAQPPVPLRTLGLQADLTGPGRATGIAHRRGAQLAVDRHNARTDKAFRLALRVADDRGTAAGAEQATRELLADPAVLAVLGPTWEAAAKPLAVACSRARLPLVMVSVGDGTVEPTDQRTACRTRLGDGLLVIPLIHYLSSVRPTRRLTVIVDREGGDPAWKLSNDLQQARPAGSTVTPRELGPGDSGFAAAARAVLDGGADAVVYAGASPARAARLARALADARFGGTRATTQQVMEPAFLDRAGPAAEGWVFGAAFSDPVAEPAARAFTAAHRAAYRTAPDRWAAETYDAVGLLAGALGSLSADAADRAALAVRLFRTPYQGIVKRLEFNEIHMLSHPGSAFLYRVTSGRYRFLGRYDAVRPQT